MPPRDEVAKLSPKRRHGTWVILLSFVAALLLTGLALPDWAVHWRPAWVAMTLAYWCLALPERVGLGAAWLAGLVLDAHTGALLGQNALSLVALAYLALRMNRQLRVFPLLQQSLCLALCLLALQGFAWWARHLAGVPPQHWTFLMPAVTSAMAWPLLFVVLRALRRKYRIV